MARTSLAKLTPQVERTETHAELIERLYERMRKLCLWRLRQDVALGDREDAVSFAIEQLMLDFLEYPNTFLQKDAWIVTAHFRHAQHYLQRAEFANGSLNELCESGKDFAEQALDAAQAEFEISVQAFASTLSYEERLVLAAILLGDKQSDLCEVINVTKSRVSQIKRVVIKKAQVHYALA